MLYLQVITPLALTFLVLVLAAAIALWTSASGGLVIWTMLSSVGLMGATTALLQGGLFGLAGLCPPIYVQVCAAAPHTEDAMLEASRISMGAAGRQQSEPCVCQHGFHGRHISAAAGPDNLPGVSSL